MKDSALIRPIITEKSMREAQKGRFTFETAKHADKLTIKKIVEELFKVRVLSVATRIVKGKSKRFGKKISLYFDEKNCNLPRTERSSFNDVKRQL